jgi:cysteine desulfurase
MRTIYLDYNATTPLHPAVREAMLPFLGEIFGNPSSIHHVGRRARALLDDARDRVSAIWRCKPSEVVFTSGGTESNNLAIFGACRLLAARGKHIVTSTIEHHAVLHAVDYLRRHEGFEVSLVPVNSEGRVDPADVRRLIRKDTVLVSVMAANNEIGSIQPVAEIGALCRDAGVLFHTDAVQWFGKLPFSDIHQFNADLVSVCAHKFFGPKGAGALFIRSPLLPDPILFGGGHENERRAGTENLAAVIGLVEAMTRFVPSPGFSPALAALRNSLTVRVREIPGVVRLGSPSDGLPNTLAVTVDGANSLTLLAGLDLEGICASSGSACSAGSLEPSHVVLALGLAPSSANSLLRFSLGPETSADEIAFTSDALPGIISRARL